MPMIDFLCDACGHRSESFFHSNPPDSVACEECGDGVAKKIFSFPGEYRPTAARRFDPIVLWVSDDDPNKISVPGRNDEPVQEGYHAVEITNLRDADRWAGKMNNIALNEARENRYAEKAYFEQRTRERRADILAKIGSNPKARELFRRVCEFTDRKREARYSRTLDPRGHFQALSFDSSNRQGYSDAETGWKDRK